MGLHRVELSDPVLVRGDVEVAERELAYLHGLDLARQPAPGDILSLMKDIRPSGRGVPWHLSPAL